METWQVSAWLIQLLQALVFKRPHGQRLYKMLHMSCNNRCTPSIPNSSKNRLQNLPKLLKMYSIFSGLSDKPQPGKSTAMALNPLAVIAVLLYGTKKKK